MSCKNLLVSSCSVLVCAMLLSKCRIWAVGRYHLSNNLACYVSWRHLLRILYEYLFSLSITQVLSLNFVPYNEMVEELEHQYSTTIIKAMLSTEYLMLCTEMMCHVNSSKDSRLNVLHNMYKLYW